MPVSDQQQSTTLNLAALVFRQANVAKLKLGKPKFNSKLYLSSKLEYREHKQQQKQYKQTTKTEIETVSKLIKFSYKL